MAVKPENRFIASISRHLDPAIYREKMANPYRGGTPDMYYEGPTGTLWVEYKWFERLPKTLNLLSPKPILTPLQQDWLRRAHHNNQSVAVIVGSPGGGILMTGLTWAVPYNTAGIELWKPKILSNWIGQVINNPTKIV